MKVLKSDPLRRAATKAGFHNKDLATDDAFRAGRVHIFNEGWIDAKLAYIKSNGYKVDAEKARSHPIATQVVLPAVWPCGST